MYVVKESMMGEEFKPYGRLVKYVVFIPGFDFSRLSSYLGHPLKCFVSHLPLSHKSELVGRLSKNEIKPDKKMLTS